MSRKVVTRKAVRRIQTRTTTEGSGRNNRTSAMHLKTTRKPRQGTATVVENVARSRKAQISASSPTSVQARRARSTPVTELGAGAKADWPGTTARIMGCVFGLGSVPVLAPMLVAAALLAAVGIGAGAVFNPPGFAVRGPDRKAEPQSFSESDLKSGEYYDKLGQVHYHTRTYMRDHSEQRGHFAA